MFKHILVPTDFSDEAEAACNHAKELAKALGSSVDLIHVLQVPIPIASYGVVIDFDDIHNQMRNSANERLESLASKIRDAGLKVNTHICEGAPDRAIVDTARKLGADLIVMGTRGLSGLKHVIIGSVAERTLRTAECPVLTVKAAA